MLNKSQEVGLIIYRKIVFSKILLFYYMNACMLSRFSHVQLFVTEWAVAAFSTGLSRKEYWSCLPCPPLGDLPYPGIKPAFFKSPALAGGFLITRATWEAPYQYIYHVKYSWNMTLTFFRLRARGLSFLPSGTLCNCVDQYSRAEPMLPDSQD